LKYKHAPNMLTILRIIFCPVLSYLILTSDSAAGYLVSYYLFVVAGLTDVYDGNLARRHKNITTFGKLVDPIADKLLLAAALIPFYLMSTEYEVCRHVTLAVVLVLLGREVLITALRYVMMYNGTVVAAGRTGKFKTVIQMGFIGSILVRLFHRQMMVHHPKFAYSWFDPFHDWLNLAVIATVVVLSLVSGMEYLIKNLPTLLRHSRV
jgi:CDP-diacylglycerol---glycerol-3-phosphate 3-phosphatidyltransferase